VLFVLDPSLTGVDSPEARQFLDAARTVFRYAPLCEVTPETVYESNPQAPDGVVFFCPAGSAVGGEVEGLLRRAVQSGAVVLPVALNEACRQPPAVVSHGQSFDVVDQLRRRDLPAAGLSVVAKAFGREVMSKIQPTYSKDRLRLFLCHRRSDGEHKAAMVDQALSARHEHVFRDLIDIPTGEEAQERIDEALSTADVLVFIDTPLAGESQWVARELATALGLGIPIVWVQLGDDSARSTTLPVRPGERPHITVQDADEVNAAELADEILDTAFELSRTHVRAAQSAFEALRAWADANGVDVAVLDQRLMVYELRYPLAEAPYPARRASHVVQVYGRRPDEQDQQRLESWLEQNNMGPHDRECRAFDAAIMLVPLPVATHAVTEWSVVESARRYLRNVTEPATGPSEQRPPGLLLLGAFPKGPLSQQAVIDAVHAISTTWLDSGGALVLGGHPTFTPLVNEAARSTVAGREADVVTVYQSAYFVTPGAADELRGGARVEVTEAGDDRASSLTLMRERMVAEPGLRAAVVIGGRTHEGGSHLPGVDEEMALARDAGLPVFLLGSPGGRAAELVEAAMSADRGWQRFGNSLSSEKNAEIAYTDDFEGAARTIWSAVVGSDAT
jgi:hypothetical protein